MNIEAIVRTYIRQIRPKAKAELDRFRELWSLSTAIKKAALAINSKGKRHKHQRRLKKITLQRAHDVLCANEEAIEQVHDFDELHTLIDRILGPVPGIGELYVYDTALRIGAKLDRLPTRVYLHAGTRIGARALGLGTNGRTLEVSAFPRELRSLEPHEIEDLLCIFKDEMGIAKVKLPTANLIARSWCC
jgi:hypothetical protein